MFLVIADRIAHPTFQATDNNVRAIRKRLMFKLLPMEEAGEDDEGRQD